MSIKVFHYVVTMFSLAKGIAARDVTLSKVSMTLKFKCNFTENKTPLKLDFMLLIRENLKHEFSILHYVVTMFSLAKGMAARDVILSKVSMTLKVKYNFIENKTPLKLVCFYAIDL